jgi:hypothetical protein
VAIIYLIAHPILLLPLYPITPQPPSGVALIVFQFIIYEPLMKNCCVKGPGVTFFVLVGLSSLSIFLLPIVSHLIEPSGKYLHFPPPDPGTNTGTNTGTGSGSAVGVSYDRFNRDICYDIYSDNMSNTFNNYHNSVKDTGRYGHGYGYSAFNYHENNLSNLFSTYSLQNNINILGGSQTVNSMNYHIQPSPHSSWALFIAVAVSLVFYRVLATSAFTTLGIIVNDSVDKDVRGA